MKSSKYFLVILFIIKFVNSSAQTFESSQITASTLIASSFINDSTGWFADNNAKIWHTTDSTQTWDSLAIGKYFLKLDFANNLRGFAITKDSAYKTTNGGGTWSHLPLPGAAGSALYFLNKDTGFISGKIGIYKTTNGGTSWSTVSTDTVSFVDYFFINNSTGLAASYDNNSFKSIWRTTNSGTTWTNVFDSADYYINSIWFTTSDTGWAAGYYNTIGRGKKPIINRTTDGGLTWKNVYVNHHPGDIIGEALIDIRFKNPLEGFALSTYSESVITTDGGLTWELTYDGSSELLPSYGIFKSLDGYGDMYLAGKKGYVTTWK